MIHVFSLSMLSEGVCNESAWFSIHTGKGWNRTINIVIYIMSKVRFSLPLALCGGRVHNSGQGHHTSPLFVKVALHHLVKFGAAADVTAAVTAILAWIMHPPADSVFQGDKWLWHQIETVSPSICAVCLNSVSCPVCGWEQYGLCCYKFSATQIITEMFRSMVVSRASASNSVAEYLLSLDCNCLE